MITGLLIIAIFVFLAGLMYAGKLPALLALPLLACCITIVAGIPFYYQTHENLPLLLKLFSAVSDTNRLLFGRIIPLGILRLHEAIMTVMIGGIFAFFLKISGTSELMVKKVAELAGDKPFSISLLLTLVVACLFTTLGGLGSIILVANIYFPILLSLGIPPLLMASMFLIAISLGGIFNMVNWALYIDILKLSQHHILSFAIPIGIIMLVTLLTFMIIEFYRAKIPIPKSAMIKIGLFILCAIAVFFSVKSTHIITPKMIEACQMAYKIILLLCFILPLLSKRFSWFSLLAPLIPISLVLFEGWSMNPAFIMGILYLFITSLDLKKKKALTAQSKNLIQSCIEGLQGVAPAIAMMIGIGMVLIAVVQPTVSQTLIPILSPILPSDGITYVLFFAILAPLVLYRGPLNLWGMGSGLMGLLMESTLIKPFLIMSAYLSTGQIQGVCDPTNTYNIWIANQLKIELEAILKKTLLYIWAAAIAGLIYSAFFMS